jgi:hypothetical protein
MKNLLALAIILKLAFVSCQKEDSDIEKLCSGTWYATYIVYGIGRSAEWTFKSNGIFNNYYYYYDYDKKTSGSGSYTLSGNFLSMTQDGQTEQMTVIRLTDKELIVEDPYSERQRFVH